MTLVRRAFEHVLRLLSAEFAFGDREGPTRYVVYELAKQLPDGILSYIAESYVVCSNCGYNGAVPLISKYVNCKCGCVYQGQFPRLRIIYQSECYRVSGYNLGAIVLSSQNVVLVNYHYDYFELVSRTGMQKMSAARVSDLLLYIADPVFVSMWGYPEFYFYYKPAVITIGQQDNKPTYNYEVLRAADPAVQITPALLRSRVSTSMAQRQVLDSAQPPAAYNVASRANQQKQRGFQALQSKDEVKNYRMFKKINIPVSFSINVPSVIAFTILTLILLQSMCHLAVSYAKITQNVIVVNDLAVGNSTFVRNAAIYSSAQFTQQNTEIYAPRTLSVDSLRANMVYAEELIAQSEYSAQSYNLAVAKPKTFTANRLVASNVVANETIIDSDVFATSAQTKLNLTRAEFHQLTSLKTARIGELYAENVTCGGHCQITGVPQNLTAITLNTRRMVTESLTGKLPATPRLSVEQAAISKLQAENLEVGSVEVSGKYVTQRLTISSREIEITNGREVALSYLTIENNVSIDALDVGDASTTHAAITTLQTQHISGQLDVSGAITFQAVATDSIDCGSLQVQGFEFTATTMRASNVTVLGNQACYQIDANSSTLDKTQK